MHKDVLEVYCPNGVTESLNWVELFPFRIFCLINLHKNVFSNSISPTSKNNHQSTHEHCWVLISSERLFSTWLIWCFYPIPSPISVSSESPGILKGWLVISSTSKNNHHSCGTSHGAKSSRVIHTSMWGISRCVNLQPRKWSFVNVKAPDIVDRLLTSITCKNK